MSFLTKLILGDPNAKELKSLQPNVDKINGLEAEYEKLTDDQLKSLNEAYTYINNMDLFLTRSLGEMHYNDMMFFKPDYEQLVKKILDKTIASNDLNTLNQILSSVSAQYNEENKHLFKRFFVPILEKLSLLKSGLL